MAADRSVRLRRRWALGAVGVAFLVGARIWGLPLARERLFVWVLLALVAVSLGDLRGLVRGVVVDWGPLFAVLFAYDLLRGRADELTGRAHVDPHLTADAILPGTPPTEWLQAKLWTGTTQWYDLIVWAVYVSHFVVSLAVAIWLWRRAHDRFRAWVGRMLALTFAGYLTYVAYPAVPPWLAAEQGHLPPTPRVVAEVYADLGVERAPSLLGRENFSNPVAALPSLHAAYPMLLLLFCWPTAGRGTRVGLVAYTVAMGFVLVYGGEHYVFDIVVGWAYAIGVALAARWWAARRAAAEPATATEPVPAIRADAVS